MAFKGFGGNSGPVAPPKMAISFGLSNRSSPSDTIARSNSPPPKLRHRPRSTPSPTRSPSPPPSTKPQLNEMRAKTPPNSIPGRSRSPPPTKQIDSSRKTQVDERDIEAKARRLARFNTDLRPSSPLKDDSQKKSKEVGELDEGMDEDGEAILGSCSDMCPELEREERERKGDLDKFERLHGDRNLTSKDLAVKKYNRTAEREAVLIRPLPVLQMTVDYLLNLLSRPYDDDFLSMHNFLWDRMRAIRMDLRMQHIFNWDAIAMHEQMIRFHIVAMHELCEYTKGEGFSEGFDAHLNIEQMNKTSVELFQMYDDHRKQGNPVPSEQEFRGYYALLKLDKHPGYKVEPAELSLDLAKMTSEIRNTHEVLFARDVARACRSGNYMAFFRLARKATYLQACLMHAHFAKLRTQALASLHSALQKNQGIPVIQVEKWLGMEGEDIEGLLEYHGFSIKQYEDAYMVKEGPFLKSDRDFPTKCSQLVHQKRSAKVVDDVISSSQMPIMDSTWHSVKALDGSAGKLLNSAKQSGAPAAANVVSTEEEMPDYEEDEQPSDDRVKDWQMQEMFGSPKTKEVTCMEEADKVPHSLVMPNLAVEFPTPRSIAEKHTIYRPKSLQEQQPKKKRRNFFPSELDRQDKRKVAPLEGEHLGNVIEMEETARPLVHASDKIPRIEKVASQCIITEAMCLEKKEAGLALHRAEAESSKLKLLLRRWKRRAAKNAQSRRLRKMKADAALSSLSLGPPVRPKKVITPREEVVAGIPRCPRSLGELNIDQLIRERRNRHERMWSKLDVADVIAPIISERNPQAKCLCWKLLICSETKDKVGHATGTLTCSSPIAGRWLRTKLMSDVRIDSEGLLLSTPDTAISRKWVGMPSEYGGTRDVCCLSIVQDMAFKIDRVGSEDASLGASGLLFLLLEDVQWDLERARLQSLVRTVPPGSNLPLLILSSANVAGRGSKLLETAGSPSLGLDVTIEKRLELHNLDRTRISSWSVIFIAENQHTNVRGFLSDDCLREGLLWLARQAPLQPIVYPSNVRDLILEYLDPYMKVLLNRKPSEVMPNDCIHIFNKALDQTASEIISAAQNSLLGWPPPEIDLLDENLEVRVIKSYLPKFGWNMASNFETIVHALRLCRLPQFPSVSLSSVSYGSQSQELLLLNLHSERSTLKEIEEQKVSLEKSLYQYLSQISLTRKGDLMTLKETDLMVQKNTVLQCIGLKHFIIPKWAAIFRRIYNWRLMLLASEPAPIAYVSRPRNIGSEVDELKHQLSSAHRIFMTSGFDHPVQPSLNEMVEVSSRDISRGLRFGPSMQIVKDQFMQHAWEGDAETSLKSVVTEVPKYLMDKINGQCKAIPMQLSFRNSLVPGKGIVRNEEYRIPDLDDVQHTIEFSQTDEEIQLDRVVNEFCNKVNEQIRWTTSAIERANIRNSSARVEAAARQCMGENVFLVESGFTPPEEVRRPESNGSQSLPSEIGHRTTISTPTWATGDGMDDLTKLLEQCSAVQSSIDKRLGVYFNERNGFQFG